MVHRILAPFVALFTLIYALEGATTESTGYISHPITRHKDTQIIHRSSKREVDIGITKQWGGWFYTVDITIGTPGVTIPVLFDTGSPDLWVNPVCKNATNPGYCEKLPHYLESSTFVDLETRGSKNYGDSWVKFRWLQDTVTVGGRV